MDVDVDVDVDVDESAVERVERTEPAERAAGSEADMAWAGGGSREAAASAARHRSRISGVYECGACETSVHYSRELRASFERGMSCPALSAAALLNCSATVMPPRLLPLMMRLPTLGLLPLLQLVSRTFSRPWRRGQNPLFDEMSL